MATSDSRTTGEGAVGRFGVGLAEAAARHGALIFQGVSVTDWKASAGGYRVNTTKGSLQATQILLATGTCQQGGLGWYRRRIVPVGSFVIATEVAAGESEPAEDRELFRSEFLEPAAAFVRVFRMKLA